MHSKQKGNIGFTATVLSLQKEGFNVFSEIGDYSKIDLIAEKNGKLIRVQVKYTDHGKRDSGTFHLTLVKSGPNGYRYTYKPSDLDWFAVYNPILEEVFWISSIDACKNSTGIVFRFEKPKNRQAYNSHNVEDYRIDRLLRDFTQDIPIRDDDKVQTTTNKSLVSES